MNGSIGHFDRHGSLVGRSPAIWACLVMMTMNITVTRADHSVLADGSVVVGDEPAETLGPDVSGVEVSDESTYMIGDLPIDGQAVGGPVRAVHPTWDVAVDALMLWQGNAQSVPVIVLPTEVPVLDVQELATQYTAGPRVSLIHTLGECNAIEGNYFQARPFNAATGVSAVGGPFSLANMGDLVFDDIESATLGSSGSIQSAELNWRRTSCSSPIAWLAGFRWVQLNSQLAMDYTFANPVPFGSGSVATSSGNDLYGGQIGADVRLWNRGTNWKLNGIGKAGMFYNAAYQRSSADFVADDGTPVPFGTVSASADRPAFFGEAGLNSTYWITNCLAWRVGYSVFWAAGVAVATQQLPLNNFGDGTAAVNTSGSVLLHGVTTGFEARW